MGSNVWVGMCLVQPLPPCPRPQQQPDSPLQSVPSSLSTIVQPRVEWGSLTGSHTVHRHCATLVSFPSYPSTNKMAAETVVWYLWADSLVLAISNNAAQSDCCIIMCLPKSCKTHSYKVENHFLPVVSDGKIELKLCRDAVRLSSNISAGMISNMEYPFIIETRTFTCETRPYKVHTCFFGVHVTKQWSADWPETDWPKLFWDAKNQVIGPRLPDHPFRDHFVSGDGGMGTRLVQPGLE